AEAGIAAHWLYKSSDSATNTAQKRARQWLKELLEMQKQSGDSIEFLENVKVDLFPKEVYVFTPAGDIMALPRGATPVDLAYAVHTDVGNTCIAAKTDGRYTPLSTPLVTGQNVEIVTAPWGRPSANWLNFVVTGKARSNIRNYLKHLRTGEAIELGQRLLTQALASESLSMDDVPAKRIEALLDEYHLHSIDELLEEIGLGKRIAPLVALRLLPNRSSGLKEVVGKNDKQPLYIKGSEGMVVNFGKCCHPIPGDNVIGFLSAGRGIVIHTASCKNLADFSDKPEKWVDVVWQPNIEGEFPVEIRVVVKDQKGVLATVAAAISELGANIENVGLENRDGANSTLTFLVAVSDRVHLARIIRRVRGIPQVSKIARARG
ncbi:MAG TPA: TGS domain-containing protein, partial [Gammaproteobacteria bacterium]|nr:TGS domain-containing protein [Gammaproteobacteria bacterium]